ncbi:MAG: hypothetical protein M1522_03105 [Actinobacteria bacterium]|nr:hypothetical protein [Actinomycetota bacterium]
MPDDPVPPDELVLDPPESPVLVGCPSAGLGPELPAPVSDDPGSGAP